MNLNDFVRAATLAGLTICGPGRALGQLPPFVEFRVPKAPTVMMSDSGGSLSYEILVTNLTGMPLTLQRVEILHATDGRVLHAVEGGEP